MIQRRRNQVPPAARSCSPFLAPIRRGSAETSLLQGLVDAYSLPFHLVDQLRDRPRPLYQVRIRRLFVRTNDVRLHNPHETNETANAVRTCVRAFSWARAPDPYGPAKEAAPVWRNPARALLRWWRRDAGPGPMPSPWPCLFRPTQALWRRLFSRDLPTKQELDRKRPLNASTAPETHTAQTVYGARFRSGAATKGHPGARRPAKLPFQELPLPRRVFQTATKHRDAVSISFWCCKW